MNTKRIRLLLDKYYNGDTTLNEEEELRKYFIDNPVIPEEFRAEKDQFIMFDRAKNRDIPFDDFEKKLENLIDNQKVRYPVFRTNRLWIQIAGIAASILIVFSVYNSFKYFINKSEDKGTIEDPVMAYEETKKTLYFISEKLNHGTKELTNISKLNNASQMLKPISKLDQGLNKLQILSRIPASDNANK